MIRSTKDRLIELNKVQDTAAIQIEDNGETPAEFKEVFDKVYEVRNLIGTIRENTKKISDLVQSNGLSSKVIYDGIESRVKNTYDIAFKISNHLKQFDVKSSTKTDASDKTVLARMKRIQYGSLRQEFQNAIFENNNCVESYREYKKKILSKQAALVNASMADDELNELLDKPDGMNFFTDNILTDTRMAQEQLSQINERHTELLKIENMILEINGQFRQIAILVEQQKDNINRIEYHACDSINYVDKGLTNIQRASSHKKNTKKFYIIIAVFLLLLFVILILLLLQK